MVLGQLPVQTVIDGLLLGGIYAIAALGLTLVFGIMDIVNLAHGHFLMVGSYVAILLFAFVGLSPLVGMVVAIGFMFVIGMALQRLLLRHVVDEGLEQPIIVLFGVALIFENLGRYILGSEARTTDPGIFSGGIDLGVVFLSGPRTTTFAVAVGLILLTWAFLHRTTTGKAIRATSQNRQAAQYMGINTDRIYVLTLGLGAALAGAAGALLSMLFPISPFVGWEYLLTAFAVVVLGGVGSVIGTLIGGLFLGVSENLGALYLGEGYRNVITFTIFLVVLVIRPQGLFGRGGAG